MLKKKLIPTDLVDREARKPVAIRDPRETRRPSAIVLTWRCVSWGLVMLWEMMTRRFNEAAHIARLRAMMEDMGGMWIKAGQLVSLRRDLLPKPLCEALASLQDRASGFPGEISVQIIEEELGRPIDLIFSEFDVNPLAAASMGQVHVGRLLSNGCKVAVKVQRPDVAGSFRSDMRYIRALVGFLNLIGYYTFLDWNQMVWELDKILSEELDYRLEASSIERMRKNLKEHKVYVPNVFLKFSTDRVITMEFLEGVFMSDFIKVKYDDPGKLNRWCDENNINPKKVARRLYVSLMRQFMEDNLFHGDLHPGNIMLLRDSRVALIDFGTIGSFENDYLTKYKLFMAAFGKKDFSKAVDILFLMSGTIPANVRVDELKPEMVRVLRVWETRANIRSLPFYEKSITQVIGDLGQIMIKHETPMDWSIMRTDRSQATLDASLAHLAPYMNYTRVLRSYLTGARQRALQSLLKSQRGGLGNLALIVGAGVQAATGLEERAYLQALDLRRRARTFQAGLSKAAYLGEKMFRGIGMGITAAAVVYLVAVFSKFYHWTWFPALMGPGITSFTYAKVPDGIIPSILVELGAIWVIFATRAVASRFAVRDTVKSE